MESCTTAHVCARTCQHAAALASAIRKQCLCTQMTTPNKIISAISAIIIIIIIILTSS